ncbi:MAG: glucuronate isomerase, partial [Bacteroidales bacterium]
EKKESLPKIILYTLNPSDNEAFATLTGSYSEDGVPGKIQFGPGWWYNDQYEGIRQHLTTLSSYGLLSRFIGMTTDSRSVFSFSRHEYFRRILCNLLAGWVDSGNLPNDTDLLSNLIKDICYNNSKNRFKNI